MKFSAKGDYACLAMIELTVRYNRGETRTSIDSIGSSQNIPIKFLVQILLQLKGAGLLVSHRGAKGGYALARRPQDITLGQIIRLVDGPLMDVKCLDGRVNGSCDGRAHCTLQDVWKEVDASIASVVDSLTLAELGERYTGLDSMYHI